MKTWGEIYHKWLSKGYDPGYAAWLADRYVQRKKGENMSVKMKPSDPAYWMLFDGVETKPVVYSSTCYICNDSEFSQMGLPLCRRCPVCGGHIPADDSRCDNCGLDELGFWDLIRELDCDALSNDIAKQALWLYSDADYKTILPTGEQLQEVMAVIVREVALESQQPNA